MLYVCTLSYYYLLIVYYLIIVNCLPGMACLFLISLDQQLWGAAGHHM